MIEAKLEIKGLEEMIRLLRMLPDEAKMKALRPSRYRMAKTVRGNAETKAPVLSSDDPAAKSGRRTPGALKANIVTKLVRDNNPWIVEYGVTVKTYRASKAKNAAGAKMAGSAEDPFYWHMVEFGTKSPYRPAQPFLRPALEGHVQQVIAGFRSDFTQRLEKIAAKLGREQMRSLGGGG